MKNKINTFSLFIENCKSLYERGEPHVLGDELCALTKMALLNQPFIDDCFGDANWEGRKILYEDKQFGFCICGHINHSDKSRPPHHHGPAWAIYAQVTGHTEMTDWKLMPDSKQSATANIQKTKTYTLSPGDVHFYPIGAIHSPIRTPGKLFRIEGQNLDHVGRCDFELV